MKRDSPRTEKSERGVLIEDESNAPMTSKCGASSWTTFMPCWIGGFLCALTSVLLYHMTGNEVSVQEITPQAQLEELWLTLEEDTENECSIFLAPSSIKGLPPNSFGIYTTRNIRKGSSILSAPDGPTIPVYDYTTGPPHQERKQWISLFKQYWWGRGLADHVRFKANSRVLDFQLTFGSLPNHHCILGLIDYDYPDPPYDDSMVDRFQHAGAGAFSYTMGREFLTSRDVNANEEIFLDYGHCEEKHREKWGPIPDDYEKAASVIWNFWKCQDDGGEALLVATPNGTDAHVASLLPESKEQAKAIISAAANNSRDDLITVLARHVGTTPRTSEWIHSNGMCLDHLVPAKSRLPQAGQGGFAQHRILKGEMVVPVPVLHILDKEVLAIYDENEEPTGEVQLLMNYCFGHDESSLLLCPTTSNAALINHCSMRKKQCGSEGPNAEYRWASGWDPTSDAWRNMTLEEIAKESTRGLSMEIVALRNIEPGEEVFIDYGIEWEEAWEEHVTNWEPPPPTEPWITAREANDPTPILDSFMTRDLRKVTDHPHLFTGCQYEASSEDKHSIYQDGYPNWKELNDTEILRHFSDDGKWYKGVDYSTHYDKSHWPCTVVRQQQSGASYIVRIHQSDWYNQQEWDRNKVPRFLYNYPRSGIHYFVKPYESDQHLSGAFRQPIGIRNEMFPPQWKNRKQL